MKKSSLVSIVAHLFLLIVLSFSQNFSKRPALGLISPSVIEIVYHSGEAALPELQQVEIIRKVSTDRRVTNLTTAPENSVNINKTSQIQDNNVPNPDKESARSSVPIMDANITKAFPKFQNVDEDISDIISNTLPKPLMFELTGTLSEQKLRSIYDPRNLIPGL